jgi:two-component system, NtrC family, sensor kinase
VSVGTKLLLILVFVALAPLGVFAASALAEHEQALSDELAALHQKTAEHGARMTTKTLAAAQQALRGLAGAIPWSELSAEERAGALLLVYDQLDDIAIVSLLDERGAGIGASLYRDRADDRHPRVDVATLGAFARAVPLRRAQATPVLGDVFGNEPMVTLAMPVGAADAHWVLAVALSLRGACTELALANPPGVATRIEADDGRLLCGSRTASGEVLTATARTSAGWHVVAEQSRDAAFASLRSVRIQSIVWMALGALGAVIAGAVLAQSIQRPLYALTRGAEALAAGDLRHRVTSVARDEIGVLARTFNRMGDEIAKQDDEIRTWNKELQARVDARTKELRDAQDQLLQSKKLGAIAALGAGVAHEINNPLTGVVGLTQVLLARKDKLDDKTVRSLTSIEREALRIRDIVDRLGTLAQASVADATRIEIAGAVDAALAQHADQIAARGIRVERVFARDVPLVLGNADQLDHVFAQLVDNALRAMPDGGSLKLVTRTIDREAVVVEVIDTGRGIAPEVLDRIFEPFFTTKDHWHGAGLGLAVAHRIVEAHQGSIRAASTVGAGTTMTITFPAAGRAAHLV